VEYPAIGKAYTATDAQRAQLQAVIDQLAWTETQNSKDVPFSQGYAINAAIKSFQIPKVSAFAYDGVLGNFSVLGIEGNYANGRVRLYFLDRGSDVIAVATDPQEAVAGAEPRAPLATEKKALNSLERLQALIQPGVSLRTIEHTYRADLVGMTRVITSVRKTVYTFDVVGGRPNQGADFPKRVRDVEWLDDNTVKVAIPTREGHYLTLQRLDAGNTVAQPATTLQDPA
jgi:hypothetical protein